MPRRPSDLRHASEVNWAPLSVVTVAGIPNLATQVSRNACTTVLAVVSATGTASGHRVVLSTNVKRYLNPRSGGKRAHQVDVYVLKTRRRDGDWHNWRLRVYHDLAPLANLALLCPGQHIPTHVGHTYDLDMMANVAFPDGCARL